MFRFFLYLLLVAGINLLFAFTAAAQQTQLINGNFSELHFEQFVQKVEATTTYFFYYNSSDLDSFTVNAQANNISLTDLLKTIFLNTSFRYSIDSLHHVFITKRVAVITSLPSDFFNKNKINIDTSNIDIALLTAQNKKGEVIAINENKLYEIGAKGSNLNNGKAAIAGYVRESKTGEPIVGAIISADSSSAEIVTDQFGYYSIALSKGAHVLHINSLGMKEAKRQIVLYADGKLNIELQNYVATLKDVVVLSERRSNVKGLQMGLERLSISTIRQVPVVFGEADVLKVVLTLPGVTSAGEASTGFNVRGGSTDQNLILFGDATIYNPSHLFGFFSSFNPDVVKGVELYKSTIPEKYGGRLSSVLDVTTRDGNSKKYQATQASVRLPARLL